jgi:subtilase family serine protease
MPGGGAPGVIVPATSIEQASDVGKRVHTNHLILAKSVNSFQSGNNGYTPTQIDEAYNLPIPNTTGAGAIAIVDAYNYPNALSDFNTFSTTYSLPTERSSTATGSSNTVFRLVYATGSVPPNDGGWSQEMAIDIEWAHAMAPNAKIYLVEAASDSLPDIISAVNVAKTLPGVREVSTSFGGTETGCTYVDFNDAFLQNGVAFFAAAGDVAGQRNFPALSMNTVAVGGTTLSLGPLGTYLSESVWNQTGCGPSAYEPRPVYQDNLYSTVGKYRAGCDIAAVADPNTGVAVYDSYSYQGMSGWFIAGGTSVACPIVAGIANGSGVVFNSSQGFNAATYALSGSAYFHQITTGSSAGYNGASPWCFPTGLGTPNGLGAMLGG